MEETVDSLAGASGPQAFDVPLNLSDVVFGLYAQFIRVVGIIGVHHFGTNRLLRGWREREREREERRKEYQ